MSRLKIVWREFRWARKPPKLSWWRTVRYLWVTLRG